MIRILRDALEVAKSARHLVLSPHRDVFEVRKFLEEQGFQIEDEDMIREDGKYYPIIRTVREETSADTAETSEKESLRFEELWFGPVLLRKKPEAFMDYLDFSEGHLRKELEMLSELPLSPEARKKVTEDKEKVLELYRRVRSY